MRAACAFAVLTVGRTKPVAKSEPAIRHIRRTSFLLSKPPILTEACEDTYTFRTDVMSPGLAMPGGIGTGVLSISSGPRLGGNALASRHSTTTDPMRRSLFHGRSRLFHDRS